MSNAIIGALRVNLSANTAAFDRNLKGATKQARTSSDQIQNSMRRLAGAIAGAFSAVAIGRSMQNAVRAFSDFDRQQRVTQQILRATGNASGVTAGQIEEMAQRLGRATLASTQEVRDAANQLLTFRTIAGETFERTLNLAQDLATVGFGNLGSATQMLARALEDPAQGLNSLRRAGVLFNDEQRRIIDGFIEAGDVANAQREILNAVEKQVGGAGGAAGGGLAGAFDTLSEEIKLFTERTGRAIAELTRLEGVMKSIAGLFAMERERSDPTRQLVERIERRQQDIDRLQAAIESDTIGRAARQIQLDAMNAAQAKDVEALMTKGLQRRGEELMAQRQAEIAQAEIRAQTQDTVTQSVERAVASTGRMSEAMREGMRVFMEARTPLERYNMELDRLAELLAKGAIDQDTFSRAVDRAKEAFDEAQASGSNMANTVAGSLSNLFSAGIDGADSFKRALQGVLRQLSSMLINRAFQSLFAGFGGGGMVPGFASGGMVRGPGGPKADKIPAMLSAGEFVINAASTRKFLPLIKAINAGGLGMARGGLIPGIGERGPELLIGGKGT